MKTGLGLNFLRIVNEEGSNGWAQVFARVPFDEVELTKKGALFGVVFSKDLEDWDIKEGEVMALVDDFFNKQETIGDLSQINFILKDKYSDLNTVWMWVMVAENGSREIRIITNGNSGVWLWRGKEKIDLGEHLLPNKVLKGIAKDKDKLLFWSGDLKDKLMMDADGFTQLVVNEIGNDLIEESKSAAGLIFTFEGNGEAVVIDHVVTEETEENEERFEIKPENLQQRTYQYSERKPEILETEPLMVESAYKEDEIVSDRYVGPVGPKEKLINWWKRRTSKRNPTVMVERRTTKRKRMAAGLGLLFLVLLVVSIFSGSMKIKADNEQKQWSQFYEPIEKKRLEAVGLINVNLVGSRNLMQEVKTSFDAGKGTFLNTKFKSQVADEEKKINDSWNLASGEKQSTIDNQVSIDLVRAGFIGQRLKIIKDSNFLVLDGKMGLVVSADGKSKDIKVLAGKGEGLGWLDVVYDGKRNLLLDQTGVSVVGGARVATFDAAVSKPVVMGTFGNNIYVLDQGNKEIYRYNDASDTLGERIRWLKQGQNLAATPLDMAIDGDVWILEDTGNVEHFRRGSKETFSLNGSPSGSKYSKLAVDPNNDKIALLDNTYGSVAVYKKSDGTFIEQRKLDTLKQAGDIGFDDSGTLWVLVNGVMGSLN